MFRAGEFVIKRDGYQVTVSAPPPWYERLKKAKQTLFAIDVLLGLAGGIAAILGFPFGLPLVGFAITLLLLIQVGKYTIVKAEPAQVTVTPLEASVSAEHNDEVEKKEE